MFTPKYLEFVIQGILTQYLDSVIKDISTQTFGCLIHIIRKNSICKTNLTKFNLQNKSHSFCSMYKTCLWILSMMWLVTSIAPQCPLCRVKCSNLFVASFCFCYQHVTPSLSPKQNFEAISDGFILELVSVHIRARVVSGTKLRKLDLPLLWANCATDNQTHATLQSIKPNTKSNIWNTEIRFQKNRQAWSGPCNVCKLRTTIHLLANFLIDLQPVFHAGCKCGIVPDERFSNVKLCQQIWNPIPEESPELLKLVPKPEPCLALQNQIALHLSSTS